ncbi:hypothetical protein FA13DRAFT_1783217 [Coprinellus micaceus]|uniref:Fungal-type protein kinase domain-containing protein n=1 Tax=Coprinellus micaceus TaxID=71717 RepID=A0A4Y7RMK2_COPMI|nr:hypothetical protein FA13DRAFT_1783217 [Coprinellus micaceus]
MASNPHHSDELDVDMLLDEGSEVDSLIPRPPFPALNIDPDISDDEEGGGEIIGRGISAAHATPYKNTTGSLAEPARSVTFDPASEDVDDPWLSRDDAVDRSAKASTLPNDIRPNELRKSSIKCAERSVKQTPVRKAATTADIPHGRSSPAPSRGPELVEELGTVFVAPKIHYVRTCLLPTLAALETFKARDCYGLHANGRWVGIPAQGDYDFEKDLYTPTVTLLNKILDKFIRPSCPNGVERKVVESHAGRFQHKGEDKYTLPDIVVEARGPSFEKPANGSKLGYSNVAAIIEMKRERDMGKKDRAHLEQMSISARQVLAHQPNRHFIRCVLLSEETCRLFHFDRSGAEIFPSISFHTGAHSLQGDLYRFIRVIVTVCSPDEKVLGFDTSIQWDIVKGIKTNGRLYTNGREYFLLKQNPVSVQVIKGRAMTLWSVEDRVTKTRFIVKDSWAPEGRTGEHDLLRKAAGLVGVCQGVSFETGRGETKEYRSFFSIRSTGFCNRIASRIVMEEYGEQIQHFASKLQLVAGIRDAIAGHARLLGKAKILHRDISNKNILLGKLDTVGYRDGGKSLIDSVRVLGSTPAKWSEAADQWNRQSPHRSASGEEMRTFVYTLALSNEARRCHRAELPRTFSTLGGAHEPRPLPNPSVPQEPADSRLETPKHTSLALMQLALSFDEGDYAPRRNMALFCTTLNYIRDSPRHRSQEL